MNSDLRKLLHEIDLSKQDNSEFPYLSRDLISNNLGHDPENSLPISIDKSEWEVGSDIISRVYQIDNRDHFAYFLNNILDHAKELHHDPVMIIKYPKLSIKLKTHDLDEVTEVDLEFANFIDEIYEDIVYLQENF